MTRQFDVFQHPTVARRDRTPFLAVLQSHHLHGIDTVIVAPLHVSSIERLSALCIEVEVAEQMTVLVDSELANIPAERLRRKIGTVAPYEDDIRRALDRLFTGF